jgi:hypothetical protein
MNRQSPVSRLIFTILVVAATIAAWSGAARSDVVRYDPDTCSTDVHDQVFVRLQSGLAFAFPADDLLMLHGSVEDHGPIADPNEPEGCPLNPIVTSGFAVAYRPATASPGASGVPLRSETLQIFGHAGPTRVQDVHLRHFDLHCVRKPESDPRVHRLLAVSPVLQECRVEQPDREDDRDWPSYLVARPESHPEFSGRPFAIHCFRPMVSGGSRECSARYQMQIGLSVMYRFQDAVVPRENMAEFDLQIRAFVTERRAPEYDTNRSRQGQD